MHLINIHLQYRLCFSVGAILIIKKEGLYLKKLFFALLFFLMRSEGRDCEELLKSVIKFTHLANYETNKIEKIIFWL
jgi:hypothetical protein